MLTFSEQLCQYWKNYFICYSTTKTLIIMRAHFHIMSQCAGGPWLLFHSWFILIIINVKCMLMPRCNVFILLSPHSILLSQHKVDHRLFSRILIEFPSSPNLHNTTSIPIYFLQRYKWDFLSLSTVHIICSYISVSKHNYCKGTEIIYNSQAW